MRAKSSLARLLLKVLKEIYEVLGFELAPKTFYFITIFYSLSVCQRTDLSAKRHTPLIVSFCALARKQVRSGHLSGVLCGEPVYERSTERQRISRFFLPTGPFLSQFQPRTAKKTEKAGKWSIQRSPKPLRLVEKVSNRVMKPAPLQNTSFLLPPCFAKHILPPDSTQIARVLSATKASRR